MSVRPLGLRRPVTGPTSARQAQSQYGFAPIETRPDRVPRRRDPKLSRRPGGMADALKIEIRRSESACVVAVAGEIDMATAPQLAAALEGLDADVTVDLGGVSFLDSSGITVLVEAFQTARLAGHRFQARDETGIVRRALEVTGVDALLHSDEQDPPGAS